MLVAKPLRRTIRRISKRVPAVETTIKVAADPVLLIGAVRGIIAKRLAVEEGSQLRDLIRSGAEEQLRAPEIAAQMHAPPATNGRGMPEQSDEVTLRRIQRRVVGADE